MKTRVFLKHLVNSQAWKDDRPACIDHTLKMMMTSTPLAHIMDVYCFIFFSINVVDVQVIPTKMSTYGLKVKNKFLV